jgi:hypothetical protein
MRDAHVSLIYIISFVLKIMLDLMRMVRNEAADPDEIKFNLHSKSTAGNFTRPAAARKMYKLQAPLCGAGQSHAF